MILVVGMLSFNPAGPEQGVTFWVDGAGTDMAAKEERAFSEIGALLLLKMDS